MEFIFLGTSSGTPTKTRNVSGLAIKKANSKSWYLVYYRFRIN
jgi:ribonuclease Z